MTDQIESAKPEKFEEPEGVDTTKIDLGEYPIDSVLIRTEPRTIFDVVRRMTAKQYILDPDFQRDFVWSLDKQSKLIESALMRIPLPVFYLAEQTDGRVIVVDGLQRLTTFYRYLNNEFAIKNLEGYSKELNGKYFRDLPSKLQTRLEDTNITLYLIDSKVPEQAKLDIFERVNSGVPLSRQQMRNCLYVGPATRWLKEQAKNEWFLKATAESLNPDTMRDREAINRFCAFYWQNLEEYSGDMDVFLAKTLKQMTELGQEDLRELSAIFETSMKNNFLVFGRHSFRKHQKETSRRSNINFALFDVFSVLMTKYSEAFVIEKQERIREIFYQLMEEPRFTETISLATSDTRNVKFRFNHVAGAFQEL